VNIFPFLRRKNSCIRIIGSLFLEVVKALRTNNSLEKPAYILDMCFFRIFRSHLGIHHIAKGMLGIKLKWKIGKCFFELLNFFLLLILGTPDSLKLLEILQFLRHYPSFEAIYFWVFIAKPLTNQWVRVFICQNEAIQSIPKIS
jgi:hypothetical protein